MDLKGSIGSRIRQLREARELTQEQLAFAAKSDAATLSKLEAGKRNITVETLADYLAALGISAREFFSHDDFGVVPPLEVDDLTSVDSEFLTLEEIAGGLRVHFPCGKHDAHLDFPGLEREPVADAILLLRRGLRQADLPLGAEATEEENRHDRRAMMSATIAEAYLSIVQRYPRVNPSDVWRYIIYRAFLDPKNHPTASAKKNFGQSFARTSGWAFERILVTHYGKHLQAKGVSFTKANADETLATMGLTDRVSPDKVDLFLLGRLGKQRRVPIGVIHAKVSLAERRTDDVPASRAIIDAGYLSLFVTMDGKDTPSATPLNRGEYGPPLSATDDDRPLKGSDKRKDIEVAGHFSAVFSFNANTIESPPSTPSGSRIVKVNFAEPADALTRFILSHWERVKKAAPRTRTPKPPT